MMHVMRTLNRWDWYVYDEMFTGEPDQGKAPVRFDEGCRRERHCYNSRPPRLLYRLKYAENRKIGDIFVDKHS